MSAAGGDDRSVEVGNLVRLPARAEPPIKVYINGVEQTQGVDYELERGHVVFTRQIVKERVSGARWFAMLLGLFGSYGRNEVVDLEFQRGGKVELAHDVEVRPGPS